MDTIIIKGLEIFAYHGVNPEEKRDGQRFVLDLTLRADLSAARRYRELRRGAQDRPAGVYRQKV